MAYRNIYYDINNSNIHLWCWNQNGERTKVIEHFEPFLYIESENGTDGKSIFQTPLKKIKFKNQFDRARFLKESPLKRIFYNINPEQQYLLQKYQKEIYESSFGSHPLKIFYLDIETYAIDHFSTPENATDPINLITIYDSLSKKFYTWGCKNYSTLEENIVYFKCKDERDLLKSFVSFWKNDPPDLVTGWNVHGYDIPYIMNRLTNVFNEDYQKKLSPIERVRYKENVAINKLGRSINRWFIGGISILDYMELYETLCGGKRESMSLNYISEYELGESKVAIGSTSLSDLANKDWFKFVDYNIQDVRLLINLEKKLKYIKLVRNLSYRGFIPFEKSMGKVSMITGAVAHQALEQGLIIPTFNIQNEKTSFTGGYVYEPVPGLYEDLITYDANSLYPNTIITLNISTETKIGKIIEKDKKTVKILLTNNKIIDLPLDKFQKLVEQEQLSITKYDVLYTQKFKGIVPSLIDKLYKERVEAKNKMLETKKKIKKCKDPVEIEKLEEIANDNDTLSNVYKTFLNSIYGIFSQQYSPLFDIDHAASITATGRSVVKAGANIVYEYAKKLGFTGTKDEIRVYSDTDSVYFSFKSLFDLKGIKLKEENTNQITPQAKTFIDEIGNHLNNEINEFARKELNSLDPRYFFKREKICDVSLLQKKKYYILHILDKEGVSTDEFEYKGMEVAKAILSKEVKELIKDVIESAIMSKERKKAIHLFQEGFEKYSKLSIECISSRKKVNNYEKYENVRNKDGDFAKGTPQHVKSAMNFNDALKKLNLTDKYPKIESGNKIKFFYCKKNPFNYETIAFTDLYPKEMASIIPPDYKFMFEKNVTPVISRIFQIVGWPTPAVGCEEYTDLIELFS
jgi:DNA polymerase elongation subunit (family B)